jgi:succinylglutamate desuccinylase
MKLRELDGLPPGLLDREAYQLQAALGGPTLIHLPGQREPALFVAVLLHGNETVGWEAVRRLLRRYGAGGGYALPRSLSLFIGNVAAAALGRRRLDGQPDYNRVWPGSEEPPSPERTMMSQIVARLAERGVFASMDLHNNTGTNPHYACVNRLEPRYLHLATLFSRTVVYFLRPRGVLSLALAELCPSVTLECGKVGQAAGIDHAEAYLDTCLRLAELPEREVPAHDIDLFHTVAQVKLPPEVSFAVGSGQVDLAFSPELDRFNFRELPRGTALGAVAPGCDFCLEVRDETGRDVADRYFEISHGELRFRVPVMPSMLTLDERVIRQDCLCYLMERYNDHLGSKPF